MKIIVFLLFFTLSGKLAAQSTADTLTVKRKIFNSAVYHNGTRLNNSALSNLYSRSKTYSAQKQLKNSRIMIPAGAGISLAGFALGTRALIGTKHSAIINNEEHIYYKRPIFNLLGGIGMIAAGMCVMEFGNDKKVQSADVYNKKKKNDNFTTSVRLNEQGHLGLQLSF